jgi:NAD+ kinase
MKVRRALLVYKRSLLERHKGSTQIRRISASIRDKFLKNDLENRQAIDDVFYSLVRAKIPFHLKARNKVRRLVRGYDLVVVVGGDGTFFGVSHFVRETPVLLVNSDPQTSLGLFACCSRETFPAMLDLFLKDEAPITKLNRLRLSIPTQKVDDRVLNDVLFAHKNPVAMTRYFLRVNGREEFQQSSGLWVSTAAGSTGSTTSAGGKMMPITSRKLQWIVREPYSHKGIYRLLKGVSASRLEIVPESMECAVWVDGLRTMYSVGPGEIITLETPAEPLNLVGYSDKRRKDLFGRWLSKGE